VYRQKPINIKYPEIIIYKFFPDIIGIHKSHALFKLTNECLFIPHFEYPYGVIRTQNQISQSYGYYRLNISIGGNREEAHKTNTSKRISEQKRRSYIYGDLIFSFMSWRKDQIQLDTKDELTTVLIVTKDR